MKSSATQKTFSQSAVMVLACAMTMMPEMALAGDTIADVLCTVVGWFTGPIGQGMATLAIIVIGIGALMGKVSWGMAIIVGIGVAVIFGAPAIVGELGTGESGCDGSSFDGSGPGAFGGSGGSGLSVGIGF